MKTEQALYESALRGYVGIICEAVLCTTLPSAGWSVHEFTSGCACSLLSRSPCFGTKACEVYAQRYSLAHDLGVSRVLWSMSLAVLAQLSELSSVLPLFVHLDK